MKKKRIYELLSWGWLIAVLMMWFAFLWKYVDNILDSDMSGELLLGKIMNEKNCFLTDSWFYSTEIRILNIQLIFKMLFSFFSDWHVVRCVSSILWIVMVLCSFYFLLCQMECKKLFPYIAPIFVLNFFGGFYSLILAGLYYSPHLCVSFITIGLILHFAKAQNKYVRTMVFACACVLALFAGMGGLRLIINLYLPLFLASVLWYVLEKREGKSVSVEYTIASTVCFLVSLAGYLINVKILSEKYSFKSWEGIQYKYFSMDSFVEVFNGILLFFGFQTGRVLSFRTVLTASACIFFLITIVCAYISITRKLKTSEKSRFLSLYFAIGIIILVLLYSFTDMEYDSRYLFCNLVFAIPVVSINLKEADYNQKAKKWLSVAIMLIIYWGGVYRYNDIRTLNYTAPIREVADYLVSQNISNGYATYWNANVLTELSNGKIDVWAHAPGNDMLKDIDQLFGWCQLTEHNEKSPQGKLFLLFKQDEYSSSSLKELLKNKEMAYYNSLYFLYTFENYEDLKNTLTNYTFEFNDNKWLTKGEDKNNTRYLYQDGTSYGPYMSLYPGTYEIRIEGKCLNQAVFDCVYNNGMNFVDITELECNDEYATYKIVISEKISETEIRVHNRSDQIVSITKMSIEKIP